MASYIDLLEKAFIVFRLGPLSRNLRNELKKSRKIYFYDVGVRNAVIKQFNPISLRNDTGALWENFLMAERMKMNANYGRLVNAYFWRTHAQQEIDYIEDYNGQMDVFEFKWNALKKWKLPKKFKEAYAVRCSEMIIPENYFSFVCN